MVIIVFEQQIEYLPLFSKSAIRQANICFWSSLLRNRFNSSCRHFTIGRTVECGILQLSLSDQCFAVFASVAIESEVKLAMSLWWCANSAEALTRGPPTHHSSRKICYMAPRGQEHACKLLSSAASLCHIPIQPKLNEPPAHKVQHERLAAGWTRLGEGGRLPARSYSTYAHNPRFIY